MVRVVPVYAAAAVVVHVDHLMRKHLSDIFGRIGMILADYNLE
jgi:hypothetical protein